MRHEYYTVRVSSDQKSWSDPCDVVSISHIRAAEDYIKDEAKCKWGEAWFANDWYCRVTWESSTGKHERHVYVTKPRKVIQCEGTDYSPDVKETQH